LGLANLREVLDISGGHRGFPRDLENTIWSEENETDLTSLTDRYPKMDMFSRWIHSQLLRWYHNKLGHRLHDPISLAETSVQIPVVHYSDDKLIATANAISTILSSLLPAVSIVALYFIPYQLTRIASIIAFCLLFSIVLTLIANPRRIDCFAATAAFAAVQVVFVGTTVGCQQVN
jgi:VIT1/CCC1 family predicted Fe2+/Mn2+ transporter